MKEPRTDLAIEIHEMCSKKKAENNHLDGIDVKEFEKDGIYVTEIEVKNEKGSRILNKPVGRYITLDVPDLKYSVEICKRTSKEIAEQIKKMYSINNDTKTLVIGLGNKYITPDALGPKVMDRIIITSHIKENSQNIYENFGSVSGITPGVLGTTGIETLDIIKGVVEKTKPDLIIAIDALASRSIKRISTTIQISDTGITPGSGVGNSREGINEEALGKKVIAIGVPMVVDAATITWDSINIVLSKENNNTNSYVNDKIYEELTKNVGDMMVTPKDVDLVTDKMAKTLANGINMSLNKDLSFEEIESYVESY